MSKNGSQQIKILGYVAGFAGVLAGHSPDFRNEGKGRWGAYLGMRSVGAKQRVRSWWLRTTFSAGNFSSEKILLAAELQVQPFFMSCGQKIF